MKPVNSAALLQIGIVAYLSDSPPAPVTIKPAPAFFPSVFARWKSWCRANSICSLPVMGAVVVTFLHSDLSGADRKKTVFALEAVRKATSKHFLTVDLTRLNLKWEDGDSIMFNLVVEQAQWRLPDWKAIAELAPPDPPKPPRKASPLALALSRKTRAT